MLNSMLLNWEIVRVQCVEMLRVSERLKRLCKDGGNTSASPSYDFSNKSCLNRLHFLIAKGRKVGCHIYGVGLVFQKYTFCIYIDKELCGRGELTL